MFLEHNYKDQKFEPFTIAVIVSRFNEDITDRLLKSALSTLETLGFGSELVTVVHVPGAVEIPLIVDKVASTFSVEAIVTLGAVIRGETSHYDYVCQQVSDGCQQLALKHGIPVIFGVLTTENKEQALARSGGQHSDKGKESVMAACEMVNLLRKLS